MILKFLKEFSRLSPSEQQVFLYCLENCPHPRRYTGDLRQIQTHTQLSRLTVYQALNHISNLPHLRKAVCYIRTDIKELKKEEYRELLRGGAVCLGDGVFDFSFAADCGGDSELQE
jgi:hypothetical protein